MRMDINFKEENQLAKIVDFSWYTIQTMEPWVYTGSEPLPGVRCFWQDMLLAHTPVASEDYLRLKKLNHNMGSFAAKY